MATKDDANTRGDEGPDVADKTKTGADKPSTRLPANNTGLQGDAVSGADSNGLQPSALNPGPGETVKGPSLGLGVNEAAKDPAKGAGDFGAAADDAESGGERSHIDGLLSSVTVIGTVEESVRTLVHNLLDGVKTAAEEGREAVLAYVTEGKNKADRMVQSVTASTQHRPMFKGPGAPEPAAEVRPHDPIAAEIMDKTGMSAVEANAKTVPGANL